MKELIADCSEALRQLRRAPGFTLLATGLLAIGLGSTVAIYSLFHSIVLSPLPYANPSEIVVFRSFNHAKAIDQESISPADFRDIAERTQSLSVAGGMRADFIAYTPREGNPIQLINGVVTAGLFEVFGVQPKLGRTFREDEFSFSSARTVILSEPTWERHFGGDANILGESILLDDQPHTVIGIMPESFREPTFVDLWLPFPDESPEYFARDSRHWSGFGRIDDAYNLTMARTEIGSIAADLAQEYPQTNRDWGATVQLLQEQRTAGIRTSLVLLLGAVGLVLLVVCFNLANLLLARSIARFPELGVRLALGTTPHRLARIVVAESVILALVGSVMGAVIAAVVLPIIADRIPPFLLPRAHEVTLQPTALLVGLAAALVSALICSGLPAWNLARANVSQWLKDGASRGSTGGSLSRWQSPLVSGQVALTVTVLAAAMLLMQSLVRLNQVPPGFDPDDVLTLRLSPPPTRYETNEELNLYYDNILRVVSEVPGVSSAAINASAPLNGVTLTFPSWKEGVVVDQSTAIDAVYAPVSEDFFKTLRIPVHSGRAFTEFDRPENAPVAIINESYARQAFPGENPIGKRVMLMPWMGQIYREIVGIVGDTKQTLLSEPPPPQIYVPDDQMPWFFSTLMIRLDRANAANDVVAALRAHDSTLPVSPTSMQENIAVGSTQSRLYAYLFAGFAALALSLSALGLHASLRFSLEQRTREIGVRMALGATPASVRNLMLGRAGRLTGIGLAIGTVLALPTTFLMRSRLYGIGPSDPLTYLALMFLIAAVTALTALPLARRATRIDPASILQDS